MTELEGRLEEADEHISKMETDKQSYTSHIRDLEEQ